MLVHLHMPFERAEVAPFGVQPPIAFWVVAVQPGLGYIQGDGRLAAINDGGA